MRESRSSGSVEGVMSNRDPYSDSNLIQPDPTREVKRKNRSLDRWRILVHYAVRVKRVRGGIRG